MKSLQEWRYLHENSNPEWEQLKKVWGTGNVRVNPQLVNMLRIKIEGIKERFIKQQGVENFRELPPQARDEMAQALVVAVLKAFYQDLGSDIGPKTMFNPNKLGHALDQPMSPAGPAADMPQNQVDAPAGWKG